MQSLQTELEKLFSSIDHKPTIEYKEGLGWYAVFDGNPIFLGINAQVALRRAHRIVNMYVVLKPDDTPRLEIP